MTDNSGTLLTVEDVDNTAVRIADMWDRYNTDRRQALDAGEEARQYVFATDIDSTSAEILPHKNRTHQPKLTMLSDTLQSEYYEASISSPDFFRFTGENPEDREVSHKVEAWVRAKLEQRKFRETTGRELIADYVIYGNAFATVDYITERNDDGVVVYKGPEIRRVSPLDIVFNPRTSSFQKTPKIQRRLVHVSELAEYPTRFPDANFNQAVIDKAIKSRGTAVCDDWVETIKERGIQMDGFGSVDSYYKQDMVELLIYRGDVFNPDTTETQRRRVVYVVDRVHVIRNQPSISPLGFDGMHHAGWRKRTDNSWAQGPLDNLVGMQYRIDHLENLKADVFDLIAHPVLKIKGDDVQEPAEGYAPGAVYYMGGESDIEFLVPDTTALQADNQIAQYHKLMEEFAGAVPERRGIRTPGEKTAFEVEKLDQGASSMFVDKARNFERMLETMLLEAFELMLANYDGSDYVEIFNDVTGEPQVKQLAEEEVRARGNFSAVGARHWQRRQRLLREMANFMSGPMQDPKVRAHVSGEKLAKLVEAHMEFDDEGLIETFAGIKEDVHAQAVAQAEAQKFQAQETGGAVRVGDATGTGEEVSPGQEQPAAGGWAAPQLPAAL